MDGDRHDLCRSGSTFFSMSIIGHLEGHTTPLATTRTKITEQRFRFRIWCKVGIHGPCEGHHQELLLYRSLQ